MVHINPESARRTGNSIMRSFNNGRIWTDSDPFVEGVAKYPAAVAVASVINYLLFDRENPDNRKHVNIKTIIMPNKINRRSFLTRTACGMGAVAFSSAVTPLVYATTVKSNTGGRKKLLATTDYAVNMGRCQCFFDRSHLDDLHKYLASIGVTRHQWIYDTIWNIYDGPHSGFDLLAEAANSAHKHGIEFYAEIKPFEGGGFGETLPLSLPFPAGAGALKDIRGIRVRARPFVADNPQMCLKRRPGTYEVSSPVSIIRLVKGNDSPTHIRQEHLSILTSKTNNGFIPYKGPVSFRESVEWRPTFPIGGRPCRILHMEGLKIPADHKYILVRCPIADDQGDFTNERGNIVELEGPNGENIPYILSTGLIKPGVNHEAYLQNLISNNIVRYFELPEVHAELFDQKKWKQHFQDAYGFDENLKITNTYSLDKEGYVAIACGKPEYMLGILNPIYPEVREHWLEMVRYCLDRGVDGINFRTANHTRMPEYWDYGFNEPVLEATEGKTDYISIRHVNGNAYTQFLREARDLIKSRDKSITLHLHTEMLMPDDRPDRPNQIHRLPPNFDWQWETWVNEIADDLELRGASSCRPWNLHQVIDTFSSVTMAANKPFYFQGIVGDGKRPYEFTSQQIDMINNHQGINGYVLYETASFTRINEKKELEGSAEIKKLIKTKYLK